MPKKILEDIKPLTKTRKTVSLKQKQPALKKIKQREEEETEGIDFNNYNSNVILNNGDSSNRKAFFFVWVVAILACLFLFFTVMSFFSKATVEIKPKSISGEVSTPLMAKKDSESNLGFQIMSFSDELSKKVKADKKEAVQNKAKGIVIIYNEFSTTKQNLLIDTRLVDSSGRIYKTEKAVSVPGFKKEGNEIIPGSVEVGIYADLPGEKYNAENLDLKILGFKGSSKYEKFPVKTKGKISGGFSGERFVVGEESASALLNEMRSDLSDKLTNSILNQTPPGFLVFKDSIILNIDNPESSSILGTEEEFTFVIKGSATAYILDERQLAREFAKILSSQYDDSDVYISNMEKLSVSVDSDISQSAKSINLKAKGEVTITWVVDTEAIRNSLIGLDRKKIMTVLSDFSGVEDGRLIIKPFWKNYLPKKIEKIEIVLIQ